MMNWHSHIVAATPGQTAVIAVPCACCRLRIMPEMYRWSGEHTCWMSESTGLKLKHADFFWLPENDLWETLPC